MKFATRYIGYKEIPNHTSLIYHISGCSLECKGCHSEEYWNKDFGVEFTIEEFKAHLLPHLGFIDCVVFMVGDMPIDTVDMITKALVLVQAKRLKTAIYTPHKISDLNRAWLYNTNFVKTGKWKEHLGGLVDPNTNQTLWEKEYMYSISKIIGTGNTYKWKPILGKGAKTWLQHG